jgi:uncharacterized protein YgbK (DUF1537 family)
MIAVIADDLTGAAEIGGIGLQYNLKVEISQQVNADTTADLLIINTDSRSKSLPEAIEAVTEACQQIKRLKPEFIYKKIDSVMRGHVLAEIEAELNVLGWSSAFIAPANPHLGRTLVNDVYLINGTPVHQTSFAIDPEFPVLRCDAAGMLKDERGVVRVHKSDIGLPSSSITVGEVRHASDLNVWANYCGKEVLTAGSGGFFSAMLNSKLEKTDNEAPSKNDLLSEPVLYISGTTFGDSADRIKNLKANGGPVAYMPLGLLKSEQDVYSMTAWCNEAVTFIQTHGKAVMAIEQLNDTGFKPNAPALRQTMAAAVKYVLKAVSVNELIIEGGSSAAAILDKLHINTLYPVHEFGPGIIRCSAMNAANLHVTLKPGSYPWSEKTWIF